MFSHVEDRDLALIGFGYFLLQIDILACFWLILRARITFCCCFREVLGSQKVFMVVMEWQVLKTRMNSWSIRQIHFVVEIYIPFP